MSGVEVFTDYGSTTDPNGTATHNLTHLQGAQRRARVRRRHRPVGVGPGRLQPRHTIDNTMRQATVNLFADMGAQPSTLPSGLVGASASTDSTAPTADDHRPAEQRRGRHAGHADRHRRGRRRRRRGRRRGLDRQRRHVASRHRHDELVVLLDRARLPERRRSRCAPATTAATSGPRAPAPTSPSPARARCGPTTSPRRSRTPATRARSRSARSSSPTASASITGIRFYKAAANTGTHIGSAVDRERAAPGAGHVHR